MRKRATPPGSVCAIGCLLLGVSCDSADPTEVDDPLGGSSGAGAASGGAAFGGAPAATGGSAAGASPLSSGGGGAGGAPGRGGAAPSLGGAGGVDAATGGAQVEPPSCQSGGPGLTDCGSPAESCCTSLSVPGGTFHRTFVNDGSGATGLADPAEVSAFRLDKYLVTVGRYRRFLAAWDGGAGYTPPPGAGKHTHLNAGRGLADSGSEGAFEGGWTDADGENLTPTPENLKCESDDATWTDAPSENERLPINCVNWWEAYAFCIWDGGFLPSESELLFAAAGGDEQRRYPWGAEEPGEDNQYAIYDCNFPTGSGACVGVSSIAPVGSAPRGSGRWGHLDLVGDLMQWNLDYFSPAFDNPCQDCARLTGGSGRVIRDGYFAGGVSTLLVAYRNSLYASNRFSSFGVRCARAP